MYEILFLNLNQGSKLFVNIKVKCYKIRKIILEVAHENHCAKRNFYDKQK